jgi:SAM-dependent methyltransferase
MMTARDILQSARLWVKKHNKAYQTKVAREIENYRTVENVHDLPAIFHYWSNKYLVPIYQQVGFNSARDFFRTYLEQMCGRASEQQCRFISIGSGNCETEIELTEALRSAGIRNFVFECLDINPHMLDRGRSIAQQRQLSDYVHFIQTDLNSWHPKCPYQVIMANQSLHHFLELEFLFEKIHQSLAQNGLFLSDDIVGRNGHMRWPEALSLLNAIWKDSPERYKYNHQLRRLELEFDNWDCSKESFEGIRSQDILPLLIKRFGFEMFAGFANIIDIFIDRSFGHNFDPNNREDLEFIDEVHAIDQNHIERGLIKPTHMTAAMKKSKSGQPRTYKHLTPDFCVRWPDSQ